MEITNVLRKFLCPHVAYTESSSIFNILQKESKDKPKNKSEDEKNVHPTFTPSDTKTESEKKNEEESKGMNFTPYINNFNSPRALLFENLNKEYKYITTQDTFDGFRFEVDKNINKNLQSTHSLLLGTSLRETGYLYQFGANFTNADNSLLMMGRLNIDGSVNGRLCKKVTDEIDCKLNFNTYSKKDNRNTYEMALEVNKPKYTYNIKTLWQGTWVFNTSYTQMLNKKLQAGVDLTYITANSASIGSLGLRYNHKNNVITLQTLRQPNFKSPEFMLQQVHGYKIQYAKKISDRLAVATELEVTPETKESAMRVGWDYTFRHAKVQGSIDTSGKILVYTQDYSGIGISGYIDFPNNEYKFGFMMHVSPQQEPTQTPQST